MSILTTKVRIRGSSVKYRHCAATVILHNKAGKSDLRKRLLTRAGIMAEFCRHRWVAIFYYQTAQERGTYEK